MRKTLDCGCELSINLLTMEIDGINFCNKHRWYQGCARSVDKHVADRAWDAYVRHVEEKLTREEKDGDP